MVWSVNALSFSSAQMVYEDGFDLEKDVYDLIFLLKLIKMSLAISINYTLTFCFSILSQKLVLQTFF